LLDHLVEESAVIRKGSLKEKGPTMSPFAGSGNPAKVIKAGKLSAIVSRPGSPLQDHDCR